MKWVKKLLGFKDKQTEATERECKFSGKRGLFLSITKMGYAETVHQFFWCKFNKVLE